MKPFINKYNWKERNFPSGKDDLMKLEKYNVTIALYIFYVKKERNICHLCFKT